MGFAPADARRVGAEPYLSPERLEGRYADPTADVWAIGVVLFELLTGELPFANEEAAREPRGPAAHHPRNGARRTATICRHSGTPAGTGAPGPDRPEREMDPCASAG